MKEVKFTMKEIYKNTLGEQVIIKVSGDNCVIYMKDESKNESEICIPIEYAIKIANSIINECNR
jgi:hypothetical protein